jgi:carbon-monoxide dehydrogenase large subunit
MSRLDLSHAASVPGVIRVLTHADYVGVIKGPLGVNGSNILTQNPPQFPIAGGEVCFQGEPVAVIVAEGRYSAADAADALIIDYEPLPSVIDARDALLPSSPVVHQGSTKNIVWDERFSNGDIEGAFAEADITFKVKIHQQRVCPVSMEGRAVIADYRPYDDRLTIWTSCQAPHFTRRWLAELLDLPESKVRVVSDDVGGGFGAKIRPYPEDFLMAATSLMLGRAVKWVETRSESFLATTHGRGEEFDVDVAAGRNGALLGLRVTQIQDVGAYVGFLQTGQTVAVQLATGCYRWRAVEGRSIGVLTNKTSTDPYRGAGRPEAAHIAERVINMVAHAVGMDPADLRRKNFITEFPHTNNLGMTFDSGNYRGALDRALDLVSYERMRREQQAQPANGRYIGIGLASYVEVCGFGPSKDTAEAIGVGLYETAEVRIGSRGAVTVYTGAHAQGQGHETTFSQLVADALCVPLNSVEIRHGDTDQGAAIGLGTYGSRSLAVGGLAIVRCCRKVIDKAKALAAELLEAAPEDIEFEEGRFNVRGSRERNRSWADIAAAAYGVGWAGQGHEHGLEAVTYFDPLGTTFPFGTHACVVEVDVATGAVKIVRYVAVDDCGPVINPMIVDGQIQGGITQGLAQALFEEVAYDAASGQLRSGTLADYLVPTINEAPQYELDRTVTPTPLNELGVKGVGEAGTIGSSAAVVNAICDALAPLGITHIDMPASPERIWGLIQARQLN